MGEKYKKETILNVNLTWPEDTPDLDTVLFTQNGIIVKHLQAENIVNGSQGIINQDTLISVGTNILNNQSLSKYNFYSVSIPSKSVVRGSHAVAMVVDNVNKKIYYHDSHGEDMRKELKDFLTKLLPEYKIDINNSKQQADVQNPLVSTENDNSCALLTKYNLRDIWYKINGQEDKVCNFSSMQARTDAWQILKSIQQEEVKTAHTADVAKKIKFGIKKSPSAEELEKIATAEEKDFLYRLYHQANYDTILDQAVKIAQTNHINFCKQMKFNYIR